MGKQVHRHGDDIHVSRCAHRFQIMYLRCGLRLPEHRVPRRQQHSRGRYGCRDIKRHLCILNVCECIQSVWQTCGMEFSTVAGMLIMALAIRCRLPDIKYRIDRFLTAQSTSVPGAASGCTGQINVSTLFVSKFFYHDGAIYSGFCDFFFCSYENLFSLRHEVERYR